MKSPTYKILTILFCLAGQIILNACQRLPGANSTSKSSLVTAPPSQNAYESLMAVTTDSFLERDMFDLSVRLRGIDIPDTTQTKPADYQVGDIESFWVKNLEANQNVEIDATLLYHSDKLNMWVQTGENINGAVIAEAAAIIETQILPTNHAYFGQEWWPGIDGDERINILHVDKIRGLGVAYFWSGDEYPTVINPYSNQREMLYVSLLETNIGSDVYFGAIAHELQHLIQWHVDRNESGWLNEGMAELAAYLNGYYTSRVNTYVSHTDIQLNALSQESEVIGSHYAAASLFSIYFYDRFGKVGILALANEPENSITGFDNVLSELNTDLLFDDIFADWLVANYLEGENRGEGNYQYQHLDIPAIKPETIQNYPAGNLASVHQYGADYIQLNSDAPLTVTFTGTQQTKLIDTEPHSGDYYWISQPADESEMSLTRTFDLTGLSSASFSFWTWYEIENGWDYGYLAISNDNGRSWELLETASTTRDNPQGNSLGPGFTGKSGDSDIPIWVLETADLTSYVGQQVLIRFQYLTDGAVHEQGFVIDDISIPELGYLEDVENGDGGWQGKGFVRSGYVLPQRFIVQQILISDDKIQIHRLQLDENQRGHWIFPMDKQFKKAILIISGSTPVTREPAVYEYEINN